MALPAFAFNYTAASVSSVQHVAIDIDNESDPHVIEGVPTSIVAFAGSAPDGPIDAPTPVRSLAEFDRVFGGLSRQSPMTYAVHQFFANGGADAVIVRVSGASALTDEDLSAPELEAARRGLWAFENADRFSLLCIPPLGLDRDVGPRTRAAAIALARKHRAFCVLDPLADWRRPEDVMGPDGIPSARWGLASAADAALYFPRLRAADPLQGGAPAEFAPCGAVAGVYARLDRARGVWKAPAGVDAAIAGVQGLSVELTDAEQTPLNAHGVSVLRQFPSGPAVWGARTLAGADGLASEWKYVPVRRTALFIEESVLCGTRWVAFEPNGEPLWTKLRSAVTLFLNNLLRAGAFAGATPREAYFVKCDRDTMTQDDLDNGRVNIQVGFAPLRPAEFVILTIGQLAGRGADAEERSYG